MIEPDEVRALRGDLVLTGDLRLDVPRFLHQHHCPETATHCAAVAAEARRVAALVGADEERAEHGGWLHDVSAIFPAAERVDVARRWGIDVLAEEASFPMIIHQKLSAALASAIFDVHALEVLSAVGCHTTLKTDATLDDKVLFVADKLAWDQPGVPPYHQEMADALRHGLDDAVRVYLQFLWEQRATLRVVHPWFRAAYDQLVLD